MNRRSFLIIFFLFALLLFLTGCSEIDISKLSDEDLERISEKLIVCESPYLRNGGDCCLDKNENKICDEDEKLEDVRVKPEIKKNAEDVGCRNECTNSGCDDNDYLECSKEKNGCYSNVNLGLIVGKCNVECTSSKDCSEDEECDSNKCNEKPQENFDNGGLDYKDFDFNCN